MSLAGDVTFNTRKLLNQKKATEPTKGASEVIHSQNKTPVEVTGTGTWIRNSLIASTNPHTSIRAEP